ncbi:hypothetical protein [Arthrobacter sp. ZBG10]|uniref:hypothetical protein n=1 Tax=Arthrobacter sp. ZBG10 TaxID=1676590 RepID=UPI0012FC59A4|nr:hypothetical protein [Arthrobacter sp. ZBG10]
MSSEPGNGMTESAAGLMGAQLPVLEVRLGWHDPHDRFLMGLQPDAPGRPRVGSETFDAVWQPFVERQRTESRVI